MRGDDDGQIAYPNTRKLKYITHSFFKRTEKQVSAASQNLAFNALLFLFRHVLKKEFGEIKGVARAKRKTYIPVVLSRDEIDLIFDHLEGAGQFGC